MSNSSTVELPPAAGKSLPPQTESHHRHGRWIGPMIAAAALVFSLPLAACGHATPTPTPAPPGAGPSVEVTTPPAISPPATTPAAPAPQAPARTPTPAGTRVLSARVASQWQWPNWNGPATVTHPSRVPLPQLVAIGAGDHPRDPGERSFNRMSFTFTTGFPSYQFEFVDKLVGDGSGKPIPLKGLGALRVAFRNAQAHTADGNGSTVVTQPSRNLGMVRMVDYAQAGDFEGVLTYGIGISWPIPHSNPQIAVRAYEVDMLTAQGQHRYVVAIDVDTG